MNVQGQIDQYFSEQPPPKRDGIRALHQRILNLSPGCRLWFLDGRNDEGKIVSNPNVGYGLHEIRYANGETKDFYEVGLSANTTGISVYVMGLEDKTYLPRTYGDRLGKAKITGYCIKFKSLDDIDLGVFDEIVANHMGGGQASRR